ncbi:MAG: serine/threonine protein kinase [Cyanobacteria bacterium SZAS LIN-3]|nr:serine/threonine protein kinase [Cyanobacteria bacterium SZAS LIN-3]
MPDEKANLTLVAQSLSQTGGRKLSYRARTSTLALAFIMALSPVWLLWASGAAISLIYSILSNMRAGKEIPEFYDVMAAFYVVLIAVGAFAVYVCSDTKLVFDGQTLKLPARFLFELRGRLRRPWSSLKMVDFRDRDGSHKRPQNLALVFEGGASVPLSISGMKREDVKELIQAVQLFAPEAQFFPPLAELELDLGSGFDAGLTALHPSFTQLWEDELAGRFGSTIFVPLEPSARLQEGGIKVLGQLCFGGLSAVYLAERKDGRQVILKEAVLPLGCEESLREKALAMFAREASILATLKQERIASVLDYFVENSRHYIVLEHIEGIDLRRFVRDQGSQPPEVALRWLGEMADILAYLHEHEPPVVHRDVTPDNIVLARDGHLSLIDFGAANNLVGTATGTLVGKQSYISPEQFRGKACEQSDLYSLGATIYFVLTGQDPEPLSRLTPEPPDQLSEAGRPLFFALARLVENLTEQDVESRVKSCAELKKQIEAVREPLPMRGDS